jgi:hypothetical protein
MRCREDAGREKYNAVVLSKQAPEQYSDEQAQVDGKVCGWKSKEQQSAENIRTGLQD